jgi:hypothetical protein
LRDDRVGRTEENQRLGCAFEVVVGGPDEEIEILREARLRMDGDSPSAHDQILNVRT